MENTLKSVSHWQMDAHCSSPPLCFPLLKSLHDIMLQQQPGGLYCRGLLGTRSLPPWQVRYYNVTLQILFFGNANSTIMLDKCSDVQTRPSPTMAGVESLTKSPLSAFFSTDTLFLLHSVEINVLFLCDTALYSKLLFLVASVPIEKKLSRCRGFFPSGYPVAHL